MKLRFIDLFCGAGGMSLGLVDRQFGGGFQPVLALDNDEASVATHAANLGGSAICADIEDWLQSGDVPNADVVIGGPPCQGFSLLNRQRKGDSRRALWEPYLEIADRSNARVFIMENVAELYRSPELQSIRLRAKRLGYETEASILNAADYGVPQSRKRTIVLGWRGLRRPVEMPKPSHADPKLKTNLPRWRTVRDAISDLPEPIGTEIGTHRVLGLHFGRKPTELSTRRYRAVPTGGNRFDLQRRAPEITPDCWLRKTSGGTDLFGRLWWDRPSVTIRTEFFKPEKGRYLHPVQHRPITHREAARLMAFPDDFRFHGTKIEIARQIGNAVPPPFAGAIARSVRAAMIPLARSA